MIKKTSKKEALDPREFANVNTSELLSPNKGEKYTIIKTTEENCFIVDSSDYIILDATAITTIRGLISYSDFGALLCICRILKSKYNICMKDRETPYTTTTVSEELQITYQGATKILNKLVSKNILAFAICYPAGYRQKVYMVNPTLLRKSKKFDNYLFPMFRDLAK